MVGGKGAGAVRYRDEDTLRLLMTHWAVRSCWFFEKEMQGVGLDRGGSVDAWNYHSWLGSSRSRCKGATGRPAGGFHVFSPRVFPYFTSDTRRAEVKRRAACTLQPKA